ncbi:MAG TPA: ribbon-helix-helix protein, CopG family [Actinomycetota bacterium]|jgi:Arc/MetJ family transcription regulator
MRRTTIRLDDQLLAEAKQLAARTGRTLTSVIEDALRQTLARGKQVRTTKPPELPTFKGDGLQPGVDLDDSAGLLDIMEAGRDPR